MRGWIISGNILTNGLYCFCSDQRCSFASMESLSPPLVMFPPWAHHGRLGLISTRTRVASTTVSSSLRCERELIYFLLFRESMSEEPCNKHWDLLIRCSFCWFAGFIAALEQPSEVHWQAHRRSFPRVNQFSMALSAFPCDSVPYQAWFEATEEWLAGCTGVRTAGGFISERFTG